MKEAAFHGQQRFTDVAGHKVNDHFQRRSTHMFAIEEGLKKINGETVETFCREVVETNTGLLVEAGTTGYKGGCCRDTGGRTFIGIVCECGDFHFGPVKNDDGQIIGVEIACCGDGGLNVIMKALEFAHEAINDQRCEIDD